MIMNLYSALAFFRRYLEIYATIVINITNHLASFGTRFAEGFRIAAGRGVRDKQGIGGVCNKAIARGGGCAALPATIRGECGYR